MTAETALVDGSGLRDVVVAELQRVRARSLLLTVESLDDSELVVQHSSLMSPLVWDLAHVGNYEEQWLLREAARANAVRPDLDDIYDAFEHPRAERPSLPLLPPREATAYIADVRKRVVDSLDGVDLDEPRPLTYRGLVYGMVIQHEHQHDETMLATHQLRRGESVLVDVETAAPRDDRPLPSEVLVPAGPFVMGTDDDPWAYDNERPGRIVDVPAFWIDTVPVTNAAYAAFVEAGGYDDPRWWTPRGWKWRCRSGKRAPAFWLRDGARWARRRFGRVEHLPPDDPVQHVCWYEADAYARFVAKRLPTEEEWEKAASWDPRGGRKRRYPWGDEPMDANRANVGQFRLRPTPTGAFPAGASAYGVRQLLGDVWEWTSTEFGGYPGFRPFPYREYSEVFFGGDYKVLRGGSWATDPTACRSTFRNWDFPIRRQIFAGFRCARDAEEAR